MAVINDPNGFEWTVSNAPGEAESAEPTTPAPLKPPRQLKPQRDNPPRRLPRLAWWMLGGIVVLALLFVAALPAWEARRTRQAVAGVIARQEQARLAGDWIALRATYSTSPTEWATDQIVPLSKGVFPLPLDLPGLRPLTVAGQIGQFQVLGPGLVRADIIRPVLLADGTPASFALPQFYQFSGGIWLQTAPPRADFLQAGLLHGASMDVAYLYFTDDADQAASMAQYLDTLLTHACADWDCPAGAHVGVRFDRPLLPWQAGPPSYSPLLGSLTLQLSQRYVPPDYQDEISLYPRVVGGYPADAAAKETVRRAAGVAALLTLAQQLSARGRADLGSAFMDGLVVREAVRLGLEPAALAHITIANPLFPLNDLWLMGNPGAFNADAEHQALALLNEVLAARTATDEGELLRAFAVGPPDATAWLAAGLGLTREEATASLNAAQDAPFPRVLRPGFNPDLALNCPTGPVLAALAGQTAPLLAGDFLESVVHGWSPDSSRMAVTVLGRLGVISVGLAEGHFVPDAARADSVAAWAAPAVLVYSPARVSLSPILGNLPGDTGQPQGNGLAVNFVPGGLIFYDASHHTRLGQTDFAAYLPAPDHTHAVLSGSASQPNMLAIIPALDASSALLVSGYNPAWSPDGRQLLYARQNADNFGLHVYDLAAGADHALPVTADPAAAQLLADMAIINVIPTWSPAGDWLALLADSMGSGWQRWVALIRPDGSGLHILPLASLNDQPVGVAFSADGRFLAVDVRSDIPAQFVAIYAVADGRLLRLLPGMAIAGWSPSGHLLALTDEAGISLLREPDDVNAKPERFGPASCNGVVWRP